MGTFTDNLRRLEDEVRGQWRGSVEVDQVYAHYQHEHPEFHHPDGGQAFYLRDPLFSKGHHYIGVLAEHLITADGGSDIRGGMIEVVEDLSMEVYNRAPWEFADLRASGHPVVTRGGERVYDRPPMVHRLSPEELREKSHLRYILDPHRYSYDKGWHR